jgi:hypothetical protein
MRRKYYKILAEARKACDERNAREGYASCGVYRMPKGSRKAGWYAVCSYIEFINTY